MDNNSTAQMLSQGIGFIMKSIQNIEKGEGFNLSDEDKEKLKKEVQNSSSATEAIERIKKSVEELKSVGK